MNRHFRSTLFTVLTLAMLLVSSSAAAVTPDPIGQWTGSLQVGSTSLRLRFNITGGNGKHLDVTMDSLDQGATDIAGSIKVTGDQVEIKIPSIQGRYEAKFGDDGHTLDGTWSQMGNDLPLTVTRKGAAAAAAPSLAAVDSQPFGKDLPGTWLGTLKVNVMELRLQYNVSAAEGELVVTMDSIDQGANGIAGLVELAPERAVVFRVPAVGGQFAGTLNAAADTLAGQWSQSGQAFPLVLTRSDGTATLNRPQEPRPPYPYLAIEVDFPGGAADVELAGTLTLPEGEGPFPAVVLVSGSGPQDRNEELMAHKPFLVLADHLTRQGIAVLRYDDRGTAHSTGVFADATSADFADDAEAAVDFLRTQPEVRGDAIGIIGHSEGGLIAPMVAARRPDVAFIVLLAGPGVDGRDILRRQSDLLLRSAGTPSKRIAAELRLIETAFATLAAHPDTAGLQERLEADLSAVVVADSLAVGPEDIAQMASQFGGAWFRFFLFRDPAIDLAALRCPVLALNGSLDLQVDPAQNLPAIRAALERGGNPHFEVREIEGLNHLFQTAGTGAMTEYGRIEETMAPAVLETIATWINTTTAAKR